MRRFRSLFASLCIALLPAIGFATEGFFDSNGTKIHYVEEGAGAPILLVHGRGGEAANWVSRGVIGDLMKDYRVIALDLRGHGKSDKPKDPKKYGQEMGLDIVRLLDHLGLKQVHIVGYSLGANITAQLLTTDPGRFATAVLVASAGRFPWTAEDEKMFEEQATEIERDTTVAELDRNAIAAMLRSFGEQVITREQIAAVRVPTLGIVGSADPFLPSLEEVRKLRPGLKLVIVSGATHGGARGVTGTPEFLTATREFLAAHVPPKQ